MACSLRDSLQGSGVRLPLPQLTLRTSFPLPSQGRPQKATGRLHCSQQQLFESTTGHSALQLATNRKTLTCDHLLRLPEHTNHATKTQPRQPCENPLKSVGKGAAHRRRKAHAELGDPLNDCGQVKLRPPPRRWPHERRPTTPSRALQLASAPQQIASTPPPPGASQCSTG